MTSSISRRLLGLGNFSQQFDDFPARRFVEASGGLVCEDELWLRGESARDGDSLLFAIRELCGSAVGLAGVLSDQHRDRQRNGERHDDDDVHGSHGVSISIVNASA